MEDFLGPVNDGAYDNVPFEIRQKLWAALETVEFEWFLGLHHLSDEEIAKIQKVVLPIMDDIYKELDQVSERLADIEDALDDIPFDLKDIIG